jgi:hypothetical protein
MIHTPLMERAQLESVLHAICPKHVDGAWTMAEDRSLAVHATRDGAALRMGGIVTVRLEGPLVYARTEGGETCALEAASVLALTTEKRGAERVSLAPSPSVVPPPTPGWWASVRAPAAGVATALLLCMAFAGGRSSAPAPTPAMVSSPPSASLALGTAAPSRFAEAPSIDPPPPPPPSPSPPLPEPATALPPRPPPVLAQRPSAATGTLSVICSPPCDDVNDNGTSLGPSPLLQHRVAAGRHQITLRSGATTRALSADVREGEFKVIRESMEVALGRPPKRREYDFGF